jgi:hypothetical protein
MTEDELEIAIAQAKALWTEMGREMKALGPATSDGELKEIWLSAPLDRKHPAKAAAIGA